MRRSKAFLATLLALWTPAHALAEAPFCSPDTVSESSPQVREACDKLLALVGQFAKELNRGPHCDRPLPDLKQKLAAQFQEGHEAITGSLPYWTALVKSGEGAEERLEFLRQMDTTLDKFGIALGRTQDLLKQSGDCRTPLERFAEVGRQIEEFQRKHREIHDRIDQAREYRRQAEESQRRIPWYRRLTGGH